MSADSSACLMKERTISCHRDQDIDPRRRHGQQHENAKAESTGVTNDNAEALDGGAMIGSSGTSA